MSITGHRSEKVRSDLASKTANGGLRSWGYSIWVLIFRGSYYLGVYISGPFFEEGLQSDFIMGPYFRKPPQINSHAVEH